MSGEKATCWRSECRTSCYYPAACHTPTPVPSEVAETTARKREVEALRVIATRAIRDTRPLSLEQRFAEAVTRSDWLAALLDRVRREEGERIAQAIEAKCVDDPVRPRYTTANHAYVIAARIARDHA